MPHSTVANRSGVNVRKRSPRAGSSEWNPSKNCSSIDQNIQEDSNGVSESGNHPQHRSVAPTAFTSRAAGSRGLESSSERPPHRTPAALNRSDSSRTRLKPHNHKDKASNHSKVLDGYDPCNTSVTTMETMTDSRFSCNICLESVEEPVVTQCGHLYCWPCLFQWLEPGMTISERQSLQLPNTLDNGDASRRHCPVCKASCAVSTLIPIYVRSGDGSSKDEVPLAARAVSSVEKENPSAQGEQATTQNSSEVDEEPIQTSARPAAVANRPSQTHLSEIDDKCSSSSTIATEQEDDDEDGNNGDDGEADQDEIEPESLELQYYDRAARSTPPPAAALGALQRQRREPSVESPLPGTLLVPNNAHSSNGMDHRPRAFSENAVGALRQQTGTSRTLAISQGLALSLHRALQPTSSTNSTAQAAAQAAASMIVPPLHRPEGFGNAAAMNTSVQNETDPDATEFLSRALLMLASFVIFCLLLF